MHKMVNSMICVYIYMHVCLHMHSISVLYAHLSKLKYANRIQLNSLEEHQNIFITTIK